VYERPADHRESKKAKEVYPTAKASGPHSSSHAVSLEKGLGDRGRDLSEWEAAQGRSQDKGAGGRKQETKRSSHHSNPGIDVVKKKMNLV